MVKQQQQQRSVAVLLPLVLLLLCSTPAAVHGMQKGASVTLRARWQGTPYIMEAAEFLVSVLAAVKAESEWRRRALCALRAARVARVARCRCSFVPPPASVSSCL